MDGGDREPEGGRTAVLRRLGDVLGVDDLWRRPPGLAVTPFRAFWPLNRDFSPPPP